MDILVAGNTYLVQALRKAGHAVFSVGHGVGAHDLLVHHPVLFSRLLETLAEKLFTPQAFLYADDGNVPWLMGLEAAPFPSVFFAIDTHCNPWHVPFAHAFDYTLVAQKDFLPLFLAEQHRAEWFPLFAPACFPQEQSTEEWLAARDIPLAFVGTPDPPNNPLRLSFLKAVKKRAPLLMLQGPYAEVYRRSRIVLNQSVAGEVNFRCFEAMSCGAALLHDSVLHGFKEIFPADTVLPVYAANNAEEAAAMATEALGHPENLAKCALWGQEFVQRHHSASVRATVVSNLFGELLKDKAHMARLGSLPTRRHFLSTAYATFMVELDDSLQPQRELYAKLFRENVLDQTEHFSAPCKE